MLFNTHDPGKFAFSKHYYDLEDIKALTKANPNNLSNWGIIGVPFDSTSSYHSGSRLGPIAIREASNSFEKYDISYNRELITNFYDFGDLNVVHGNCRKTSENLEQAVDELLSLGLFPIILGGEHSISLSPLKSLSKEYDINDITIVHFDAHMDMIDTYQGEKCSHATVMRRIHELSPKKIVQIGIRSASLEEDNYGLSNDNIEVFTSNYLNYANEHVKDELASINGPIYLSIDLDVFDPIYVPAVGNPIPNGISPNDMNQLLGILTKKQIIGFDLVELSTNTLGDRSAITAAKIVYDFLTLIN
ncbi:agmatinase [Methanobrevibacter cuticularis]|uniref:Agmatinase n=1 Tax=Methanobrevibacter cuticularis TaxID=47311 RepID=A0A166CYG9_9EURY|nr:agmatinase [Methanobrevibacter cuticularis]KZX14998.1 agmatinase [Methanobrevibacter cuticularis]